MHRAFEHNTKAYKAISEWMDDSLRVIIQPDKANEQILYSIDTTRDKLEGMKHNLETAKHASEDGFIDLAIEDFKSRHR